MMTTDVPGINLANTEGIPKTKRDQCSVCEKKINGERFSCVMCRKTLHMTADCTGFSKNEVSTIIKLNRNLLHVCNDCSNERKDDVCILTPEQQKQKSDLNSLDEKLTQYNENVIQSLHVVKEIQKEIDSLKRDQPKSYTEALRSVKPGKTITVPIQEKRNDLLGIRIRGIPEAMERTSDERLKTDINSIKNVLQFLENNGKITKVKRIGPYDDRKQLNGKPRPRSILFYLEDAVDKDLLLKSARKLKDFSAFENPIYLSPELTVEDASKERECLKHRRKLILDGIPARVIRIRNLELQQFKGNEWCTVFGQAADSASKSE